MATVWNEFVEPMYRRRRRWLIRSMKSLLRKSSVWPDVGTKSGPIYPKGGQKLVSAVFGSKAMFSTIAQKVVNFLATFVIKFVVQDFQKSPNLVTLNGTFEPRKSVSKKWPQLDLTVKLKSTVWPDWAKFLYTLAKFKRHWPFLDVFVRKYLPNLARKNAFGPIFIVLNRQIFGKICRQLVTRAPIL